MSVEKREVKGKVKKLYREGLVIGNIYGRGQESVAIQAEYEPMRKLIDEAGTNHAIELKVGEKEEHLVLIKHVDFSPTTSRIRHVEFQMVNKNEKIEAEVPVELVGTSPAVLAGNIIITSDNTVLVEANPLNLPDHLEADASLLATPDDMIQAKDLKIPEGVELSDEPDKVLFRIEEPRSQVEEVETQEEVSAADVPSDHGSDKDSSEEA
jgi:large subunit ribosomal protein L25